MSSLSSSPFGVSALAGVGEQPSGPRRKIDSFDISFLKNGDILSLLAAIEETLHESDWQARAFLAFAVHLLLTSEEKRLISQWLPYEPYEPYEPCFRSASAAPHCDAVRGTIDQLACPGACRGHNRRRRRRSPRCTTARTVCNAASPEHAAASSNSHVVQRVEESATLESDSRTRPPLETPSISQNAFACAAAAQRPRRLPRSRERTASINQVRHCSAAHAAHHPHRLGAMRRARLPAAAYHLPHGAAMRALLPAETARPPGEGGARAHSTTLRFIPT